MAMTHSEYLRMTERELRGRKVRTLIEMSNGYVTIPEGTILTITRKMGGLHLIGPKCAHCGVQVNISKVTPQHVFLLPIEEQ